MTRIDGLRFDSINGDPCLCTIDLGDLKAFLLDEELGPAVYVVERRDLEAVLAAAAAVDKTLITNRGEQTVTESNGEKQTMPLTQALRSVKGHGALQVRYRAAGKLTGGVRKFLENLLNPERPRSSFYFLGTSAAIWGEVAREVAKQTPEDRALRALRTIYVGNSRAAEAVRIRILMAAAAALDVVIVINGESGTGKEVVARAIHDLSRRLGRFRPVNSGEISTSMPDAIFFGHEKGVFTGADERRPGLFEQANGGTLFFDEIAEMPAAAQAMILRAMQERVIYRVGGDTPVPVAVKIVVATHRNLRAMVGRDAFRDDLLHRLGAFWIMTPTLREHRHDLALHIARIWQGKHRRRPLPADVAQILRAWEWPGNVRQLESVLGALNVEAGKRPVTREMLADIFANLGVELPARRSETTRRLGPATAATLEQQVQHYRDARPRYLLLEMTLRAIIERIVKPSAPLTVVRSHTTTVAHFAERVQRAGPATTDDSLALWRTLSRVRAVVYTQEEKEGLYAELLKYLELADTGYSRPPDFEPSASGFRPFEHYVRIREGAVDTLARVLDVAVPREALGLWGRVRLRTILEEVTLAVRDEVVPSGTALPKYWEGKLIALQGVLSDAQRSLGQIYSSVRTWAGSYGAYVTEEQARRELAILEQSLACVPEDPGMAARAGKLAMILGDWDRAIAILEPHVDSEHAPVLRDLGVALCKKYEPGTASYHEGLSRLADACRLAPRDLDAFASYAGALKRAGQLERARTHYGVAVEIDGTDPYAIGGCLETNLMLDPQSDIVAQLTPAMERAILRCRDRVAASVDLPWAFFDLGKYLTLLGESREGLAAYAEGVGRSNAPFMLETTLRSVESLVKLAGVPDFEVAQRIIAVGWCARFPSDEAWKRLAAATPVRSDVQGPVVMVIEAAGEPSGERRDALRATLTEGLREFRGTVLTVGGGWGRDMVEEALNGAGDGVRTIDYGDADAGSYPTLRPWADVVGSKVDASEVVVLMLGTDHRRRTDRRLAVEIEARVVVVAVDDEPEEEAVSDDRTGVVEVRDGKALASVFAVRR